MLDKRTFDILMELSKNPETSVHVMQGYEVFKKKPSDWKDPWFASFVEDYGPYKQEGFEFGIQYKTVGMNPPVYLEWLKTEFRKNGGKEIVKVVHHIDELVLDHTKVVVNCSGIGIPF
jgi:protein-tyrosine phosphatase